MQVGTGRVFVFGGGGKWGEWCVWGSRERRPNQSRHTFPTQASKAQVWCGQFPLDTGRARSLRWGRVGAHTIHADLLLFVESWDVSLRGGPVRSNPIRQYKSAGCGRDTFIVQSAGKAPLSLMEGLKRARSARAALLCSFVVCCSHRTPSGWTGLQAFQQPCAGTRKKATKGGKRKALGFCQRQGRYLHIPSA